MKGRLIAVKKNGDYIKCEQDCTLNYEQEMLPASSREKGYWRDFLGGLKSWSVDVTGVVSINDAQGNTNRGLESFINNQDEVFEIVLGSVSGVSPQWYVKGFARLQSGTINAPIGGSATHGQSFIGCGALESFADRYRNVINEMEIPDDKPLIIDTTKW